MEEVNIGLLTIKVIVGLFHLVFVLALGDFLGSTIYARWCYRQKVTYKEQTGCKSSIESTPSK